MKLACLLIFTFTFVVLSGQSIYAEGLPRQATATAEVVNGFVVGIAITDPGGGYPAVPSVGFQGGGGTGAEARVTLDQGTVVQIIVENAGSGYTSAPDVVIGPPPPLLDWAIRDGRLESHSTDQGAIISYIRRRNSHQTGLSFQTELSLDMRNWEPHEDPGSVEALDSEWERVTAEVGLPAEVSLFVRVQIAAPTMPPPSDFVLIPGGSFQMGDVIGDLIPNGDRALKELPVHTVNVRAFFLQARETTKAEWDKVRVWALRNGYEFENTGFGKATDHPVHTVNWYDVVKWCNARSEMEGLTPCYYLEDAHTSVYRTGLSDLTNTMVDWGANGYRLPTEAEWEKAARGGLEGRRFPWGDTITHALANYWVTSNWAFDTNPTRGHHPDWEVGDLPYTSPVGSFSPNGYGLFDMAGNVWEWCWDWLADEYYTDSPVANPLGPASGEFRVARGGSCCTPAVQSRVAERVGDPPSNGYEILGFRPARGQ